jgi:hypothetical protein
MYHPYKRATGLYLFLLFGDVHIVALDAIANKLLSAAVRLKYFSAYIHIDVVVKSPK